ncbi:hypothetical protein CWS72_26530 [Telmatospirillum siberiense]|uniref:Endonuclease NucS C-terminal domain-containing protein n=1 Tax=Telmatospirillum siberiense TaxID=382514 RepID=A0A2N3PM57_9PROT|nr:hypothetical protein CWS72_26530 [Telmatospirillum siberiense]
MEGSGVQIPETIIRDRLAADLSMLEPGLTLVATEFQLSNPDGAGGRIDVLARDEFKNFVIIEIKRSDAAARQALHEVIKYASILMRDQGIKPTHLRVIIVSTDWHELRKPFSEYLERPVCHTTGYKIRVDPTGKITHSERLKPLALAAPIEFSPTQMIYLYESPTVREYALPRAYDAMNAVGASDHVLIRCNYQGSNPQIIFPYGIYMVIATQPVIDDDDDDHFWGTAEDRLWQKFTKLEVPRDTAESGGRDCLAQMLQSGWRVEVAARSGRFEKSKGILTDDDLLDSLVNFDDASQFWMCAQATPRFDEQWTEFRRHLDAILAGNALWRGVAARLLDEIAARDPEAKISVNVYNLADTAQMLDGLVRNPMHSGHLIRFGSGH